MLSVIVIWLQFGLCSALIIYSGTRLSRYGDVIADKTGLSGSWIGLILLATVTSLPELATGASAVTIAGTPNIAVGDVLGSCVFNLLILVVLDFMHRGESVYRSASQGHILLAAFGIVLIGLAGSSILLGAQTTAFSIGHMGGYTPIVGLIYFLAMRAAFNYQRAQLEQATERSASRYPDITLRKAIARYSVNALVVVGAGIWLPFIGSQLALIMGWHNTFVGTLFIAGATSLPELTVAIAALRINALDMAIANLLGSNLFDIFILAIDDLLYTQGPILSHVSSLHAMSALSALMMNGIVIIGLLYRPRQRIMRTIGWISIALLTVYVMNSYVMYFHSE